LNNIAGILVIRKQFTEAKPLYVAYGDGETITNDTQCGIFLDGSNPTASYG
jgi:hypothetical protein